MVPSIKFTLLSWTVIIFIGFLAALARHKGNTCHTNKICPKKVRIVNRTVNNDWWNRHRGGVMRKYRFSLPGGYQVVQFKDKRPDAANRVFQSLEKQGKLDFKLKNFMTEIDTYINLMQGDDAKAKILCEIGSADQKDTYPVSYNRANNAEVLTLD